MRQFKEGKDYQKLSKPAPTEAPAGKIEILETKIEGDKATVRYRNPEGKEETDTLVKEDGEWKLDFNLDK